MQKQSSCARHQCALQRVFAVDDLCTTSDHWSPKIIQQCQKDFFLEIPSKLGCGLADNTLWFHFEPIWGQDRQTILIAINKYKGKLISVKYAAIVFMLVCSFMLGSSDCSCALEAVTIPCMPPLSMLDTTHINHAHCACDAFLLSVLFHSSALMNISSQV